MDDVNEGLEILKSAVFRIDTAVILVGVRTSERPLAVHLSDWMDRKEPDDVRSKSLYAVEIRDDRPEAAFFGMVSDVNRIYKLFLQGRISILCHFASLLIVTAAKAGDAFDPSAKLYHEA